ncbi:2-succinyl-5-enolpyruvyl-6-hydroxy-3-cyclohexene-1-carboxylic-acid synthase [Bombilactobacillus folatiphilus]|uniref:2-succinyl-5-enolpyruvyl-6-hydroxy-3-cyclohexene-1-carboxylate synthase n=1 Tax=Bombilactobacillus folatiphilus TaxID=2923362 RepID=A0ABY4P7W2_9LACO|nr:2-succinyl-5-enolpyruvyl-6-hydroxy-3-cyclohexene-1-carboxylic-acid synthase [Bombilactobacillus folatiphilus]UQS81800.1 2-succinyl-5-enolpyruvyl-6-hydroxy-3-cyclohexene-1-carboxylic-acid synthase [Bombilactobacillus folatiphilus]
MTLGQSYLTQQLTPLLATLLQTGIKDVVLSPGSRSTPVAILLGKLADQQQLNLHIDVDERSAAFMGLGIAKTSQHAVLLVCTSGTAAANYYPAICEAYASNIPLIVLTTDRPQELQQVGAPQTLTQANFYGQQVKASYQLPTPRPDLPVATQKYFGYIAQKAVHTALQSPKGPVQLNLPLRKPLLPATDGDLTLKSMVVAQQWEGQRADQTLLTKLETLLSGKKGLIIAGPNAKNAQVIQQFAQKMNWPLLADPLSSLRGYPSVLTTEDWLFQMADLWEQQLQPEVILRLGATPVSAALSQWLAQTTIPIVYLDADRAQLDHTLNTRVAVALTPAQVLPYLSVGAADVKWLQHWSKLDQALKQVLEQVVELSATLTEPQVAWTLGQNLPSDAALFVSNSMPIREVDDYFHPKTPQLVLANRGANGIDGINSTALGMASQRSQNSYLYVGDLAFFHDLTGLMLARQEQLQLTIIVQNNQGGGIFSFLPQAQEPTQFEKVFGTPLHYKVQDVAQLFGGQYYLAQDQVQLAQLLRQEHSGLTLIEVATQRSTLTQIDAQIKQAVTQFLEKMIHAS